VPTQPPPSSNSAPGPQPHSKALPPSREEPCQAPQQLASSPHIRPPSAADASAWWRRPGTLPAVLAAVETNHRVLSSPVPRAGVGHTARSSTASLSPQQPPMPSASPPQQLRPPPGPGDLVPDPLPQPSAPHDLVGGRASEPCGDARQQPTQQPQPSNLDTAAWGSSAAAAGPSNSRRDCSQPGPSQGTMRASLATPNNKRAGGQEDSPSHQAKRSPHPEPQFSDLQLSRLSSALLQTQTRSAGSRAKPVGLRNLRAGYADALDDVLQQPAVEATASGCTVPVPSTGWPGHLWAHQLAASGAARRVLLDLFGRHTQQMPSPEELDARAVAVRFCTALFRQYDKFISPEPRRATKRTPAPISDEHQQDQQQRRSRTSSTQGGAGGAAQ
jgi:hypothetical protein